jgi:hypothetical protein
MMNGPMMSNDMISGKWMHKTTGETIIVNNSVMDGDQMILVTNVGMLNMAEFSENFIQVSDDIYDESGKVVGKSEAEFVPEAKPLDMSTLTRGLGGTQPQIQQPIQQVPQYTSPKQSVEDEDTMLVRRLLKNAPMPTIKCDVSWERFPSKQLEMLEMMGVETAKIVEFFVNQIDLNEIRKIVEENILMKLDVAAYTGSVPASEIIKTMNEETGEPKEQKPVRRKRITNK